MANRFPLIANSSANQIQELAAGDNLDLTGSGISNVGNINASGISTLGNTVVGGGTTQLVVTGNARITGILTIGTSSITLDGSSNQVNVGTGVTLHHTDGVQVGGNNLHSTVLTVNQINASGVITATSFSGSGANLTGIAATTNVVTNSLVVSGITTVAAGSTAAPSISPTGDSNTGIFFPAADTIAFGEGGSEAARIDSSGRLLLGTSTATANGGVLQVSNGITFPATQSACSDVNTLDDYEEGTWTPTLYSGFSTAPTSYSQQSGHYTKIGRYVFITINIHPNGAVANNTTIKIAGLPFVVASSSSARIAYQVNFNTNAGDSYNIGNESGVPYVVVFDHTGNGRLGNAAGVNINNTIRLSGSYEV